MAELLQRVQAALDGRYGIERPLGEGASAVVFLSEDRKHQRPVAVKVLRPEVAASLGAARFLREISLAARLSHPHILTLIDSGETEGLLYYVMPHVRGGSLRGRLQRDRRLPLNEVIEIGRAVAGALDYAHRQGVVHRDIKPENILLHDGLPVIADFGIATALSTETGEQLTTAGIALGTPAYMSPEQITGAVTLDGRCDIYALGCVLYELLTGRQPFPAVSLQATLGKRLMERPPRVRDMRDDIPAAIDNAILRAMDKDPAQRFSTGALFAEALLVRHSGPPPGGSEPPECSVAVLPFANFSSDAENEYFSDGISEEIIGALSKVRGLRVTARTSAFAFKGANRDIREIGAKLNVSCVLEGSVRKAGGRIRIAAQLVDVEGGFQLWSDRFDRDLEDIFAVQDEIANIIATKLRITLAAANRSRERPTTSLAAYDAYLRGKFASNKGTKDSFENSVVQFGRALELDPRYAQAHVAMAEALWLLPALGASPEGLISRARTHIQTALALDDSLVEAHAIMGHINFLFDWNWAGAERNFVRAIELGRNSATAHFYHSVFLSNLGRPCEAVALAQRALELDPLWPLAHHHLGTARYNAGHYAESIEAADRALELSPNYVLSHNIRGFSLLELGSHDGALEAFQRARTLSPSDALGTAGIAVTYARTQRAEVARGVISEMEQRYGRGEPLTSSLVWAHAALGQLDQAVAWLRRAVADHDIWMVCLPSFSWWDPLRGHPEFEAIMRELKFPAWAVACADARRVAYVPPPAQI